MVAKLGAATVTRRIGTAQAARLACALALAGSLVVAASPVYAGLGAGRALAGFGLGLTAVAGPVLAKELGGVRLVGVFGGAITLGVAAALGVGSLMRAVGIDWRLDFLVAAAVAAAGLVTVPSGQGAAPVASGSVLALLRRSASQASAWRLELLFTTALGVPYVLGIWLVPYLTREAGAAAELAGLLSVALYVLIALLRPEGARLDADGRSPGVLGGLAPIGAGAGVALLAVSGQVPALVAGALLAGAGFALPYALMYDEAQRLFPEARVAAVGLLSVGGNILPLALLPLVGAAIEAGRGEVALCGLAVLPVLAGLANLRPVVSAASA